MTPEQFTRELAAGCDGKVFAAGEVIKAARIRGLVSDAAHAAFDRAEKAVELALGFEPFAKERADLLKRARADYSAMARAIASKLGPSNEPEPYGGAVL